jgi:hypothetical protein
MSDAYTPGINTGDRIERSELDRIATASAALEGRLATLEGLPNVAYGGMRMEPGVTHNISLSITATEVGAWDTVSALNGITADEVGGELTVTKAGVYEFLALVTLSGVDSAITYSLEAYLNHQQTGAIPGDAPEKKTDDVPLAITSMPTTLEAGDVISLYLTADAPDTVQITRAMMSLKRIG